MLLFITKMVYILQIYLMNYIKTIMNFLNTEEKASSEFSYSMNQHFGNIKTTQVLRLFGYAFTGNSNYLFLLNNCIK